MSFRLAAYFAATAFLVSCASTRTGRLVAEEEDPPEYVELPFV